MVEQTTRRCQSYQRPRLRLAGTANRPARQKCHRVVGAPMQPANGPDTHQAETSIGPTANHDPVAILRMTQPSPEQDLEQSTLEIGSRCRPSGDPTKPNVEPVRVLGADGTPTGDFGPSGLIRSRS